MYIQINVGRNVGDVPMTSDRWDTFLQAVHGVIRDAMAPGSTARPMKHLGIGVWVNDLGEPTWEDSAHISVFDERGFDLDRLRAGLATLRDDYEQDAIALIVGSELV